MPVYIVHLPRRTRSPRCVRPRPRLDGVRRDMPAVPVPVARRPRQRVRGREVRLLPAPPRRTTGTSSGRASSRTTCRSCRPTTARSTSRARRNSAGATSGRSRTDCPASRTGSTCCTTAAWSAADHPRALGGSDLDGARQAVRDVSTQGLGERRGRRDLVIYDPNRRRTISAKTHHMDVDYSCYEGREVQGASDVVLSRGSVIVRNGEFGQEGRPVHQALDRRFRPPRMTLGTRRSLRIPAELGHVADVRELVRVTSRACDAPDRAWTTGPGGRRGDHERDPPRLPWRTRLGRGGSRTGRRSHRRHGDGRSAPRSTTRVPEPDLSIPPERRRPAAWASTSSRRPIASSTSHDPAAAIS